MIDLKRTWYMHVDVCPLAAGAPVAEEGCGLIAVLQDGVEKVLPSAGAGGEKVVGFAVFRQKDVTTRPIVMNATIPSAGPFVVELDHQNLVGGSLRVYSPADAGDFLVVGGAPLAGQVQPDLVHGTLTFNGVGDGGKAVVVYYKYQLTLAESKLLFYEAPTNYPDPNYFSTVGVGKGKGRLFTAYFDTSKDYSLATAIKLDAGGMLTDQSGAGTAVPNARVVSLPTVSDPTLGIEFLL